MIALSIPLLSPLLALSLITGVTILKLVTATKTKFTSKWMKVAKVTYVVFHLLLNVVMLAIYFSNFARSVVSVPLYVGLGWMAIAFLFTCIIVDVIVIVISICYSISSIISIFLGNQQLKSEGK